MTPLRRIDPLIELTCDAQGWFWHPFWNDADMRLNTAPDASMTDALLAVRSRLGEIVASGSARLDRFVCG